MISNNHHSKLKCNKKKLKIFCRVTRRVKVRNIYMKRKKHVRILPVIIKKRKNFIINLPLNFTRCNNTSRTFFHRPTSSTSKRPKIVKNSNKLTPLDIESFGLSIKNLCEKLGLLKNSRFLYGKSKGDEKRKVPRKCEEAFQKFNSVEKSKFLRRNNEMQVPEVCIKPEVSREIRVSWIPELSQKTELPKKSDLSQFNTSRRPEGNQRSPEVMPRNAGMLEIPVAIVVPPVLQLNKTYRNPQNFQTLSNNQSAKLFQSEMRRRPVAPETRQFSETGQIPEFHLRQTQEAYQMPKLYRPRATPEINSMPEARMPNFYWMYESKQNQSQGTNRSPEVRETAEMRQVPEVHQIQQSHRSSGQSRIHLTPEINQSAEVLRSLEVLQISEAPKNHSQQSIFIPNRFRTFRH